MHTRSHWITGDFPICHKHKQVTSFTMRQKWLSTWNWNPQVNMTQCGKTVTVPWIFFISFASNYDSKKKMSWLNWSLGSWSLVAKLKERSPGRRDLLLCRFHSSSGKEQQSSCEGQLHHLLQVERICPLPVTPCQLSPFFIPGLHLLFKAQTLKAPCYRHC